MVWNFSLNSRDRSRLWKSINKKLHQQRFSLPFAGLTYRLLSGCCSFWCWHDLAWQCSCWTFTCTPGFCCLWFLAKAMGLGHTTFVASPLRNTFSYLAHIANNAKLFIRGTNFVSCICKIFLIEVFPSMASASGTFQNFFALPAQQCRIAHAICDFDLPTIRTFAGKCLRGFSLDLK